MTERASPPVTIRGSTRPVWTAIPGLAALLVDAVDSGAGVNFLAGVTAAEAAAWWTSASTVRDGVISAFVALDGDRVVGSTLLIRSRTPTRPIAPRSARSWCTARPDGAASPRALMAAAEDRARADGRWLLVLDTVTGSAADVFYRSQGWVELGVVPDLP